MQVRKVFLNQASSRGPRTTLCELLLERCAVWYARKEREVAKEAVGSRFPSAFVSQMEAGSVVARYSKTFRPGALRRVG